MARGRTLLESCLLAGWRQTLKFGRCEGRGGESHPQFVPQLQMKLSHGGFKVLGSYGGREEGTEGGREVKLLVEISAIAACATPPPPPRRRHYTTARPRPRPRPPSSPSSSSRRDATSVCLALRFGASDPTPDDAMDDAMRTVLASSNVIDGARSGHARSLGRDQQA